MSSAEKRDFDVLIVGSGISGMTLALLFARQGARVCVLEKAPFPGGSMARFLRNSCPLDTGFHFTTSLTGAFGDMFRFLGMREFLREVTVDKKIFLAESKRMFHLPHGHENILEYYAKEFPGTREKLRNFFDLERKIYENTPLFSLDENTVSPLTGLNFSPEDNIVLADYLKKQNFPPELELLLFSFAICCCGTPAEEISLSTLCRISYGLHDRLVRFDGGGGAVVSLFLEMARKTGIRILTGTSVAKCVMEQSGKTLCHRIITNKGQEITFDSCVFTTHPKDILETISPALKTADFRERVESFQESCGFFTLWAKIGPEKEGNSPADASLISYLSKTRLATLMSPKEPDNTATGIMTVKEHDSNGENCETLTIFENVFPEETALWQDTARGNRGEAYGQYKAKRCADLLEKCYTVRPDLRGRLQILDSASLLTYRDFLSPFGSAYGIRQKSGQFNIFGRLPVRNFYAAGQNALLPGAFGAMQSSFILWRKMVGEPAYRQEIENFHKSKGSENR
ncbi:MAG: NAD(P)/FAD-dependent oxidoreductase [Lentisphaeria bacterium]|nr:NAD(P)/FAD-dependent oxidoreductase [Lentisphaeria bacterium]